jgi:predicted Zn-dependent protease with MMP-like domain
MLTFDEVGAILDEIADSLPFELYRELNGGITLQPQIKIHPLAKNNDLFILGEYRRDNLGRYVVIFYGSIMRVYGKQSKEKICEKLREVLVHEVRHHNEFLAGDNDLVIYDKIQLANYLNRQN